MAKKKNQESHWETTLSEEQAIEFIKNVCGEDENGFYTRYKRPDLVELVKLQNGYITLTANELAGIIWCAKQNFRQA